MGLMVVTDDLAQLADRRASTDPWFHVRPLGGDVEQRRRDAYLSYAEQQAGRGHAPVPYWRWDADNHAGINPLGLTDDEAERFGLPRKSSRNPEQRRRPWLRR